MKKDLHSVLHADKKKQSVQCTRRIFLVHFVLLKDFRVFIFITNTKILLIGFDPDYIRLVQQYNR